MFYSSEFAPFKGGVARYTLDFIAMLRASPEFSIRVFTEQPAGRKTPGAGYPVFRLPLKQYPRHPWVNLAFNILSSLSLVLYARLARPEWCVVTGRRALFNSLFVHRLLGCKLAIVIHGSELFDFQSAANRKSRFLARAFAKACASASRIIVSNRYAEGGFRRLIPAASGKVSLLYPIIDPARVRVGAEDIRAWKDRYFTDGKFSFVTLARLSPRKGQDVVLRALGKFKRQVSDHFQYFIIGTGGYLATLRQITTEEGLSGHVHFLQGLEDTAAYALISLCDLFVMPNREHNGTVEGFGISFLEANLMGLPALAGKSGGSIEAVQEPENGLLCDGADPEEVLRQMIRYYSDEALRRGLKGSCLRHALESFSFEKWRPSYQQALS